MKGYITYFNPVLGLIYLTSLTFINAFPVNYTYNKEEAVLFDKTSYDSISRNFKSLQFIQY